jgi:hypothetical protein
MSKVEVTTYTFGKRFSETVLHELDPRYSRETVTIAAGSGAVPFGAVLTRDDEGKYAPLKETAGEQDAESTLGAAKAVYIGPDLEASDSDQSALVLRGYSIINAANLVFDPSVTKKADALNALRDLGFVVKEVPSDVDA